MHNKHFLAVLLIALGAIVLFSCKSESQQRSTLTIDLKAEASKTIVPADVPLDVTKYVITGDGPENSHFSHVTTKQNVSISGLLIGNWTLHVTGQNSTGVNLVEGSGAIVLQPDPTTTTITLSTLKGTGTLDLTVNWDKTLVASPTFELSITDAQGTTTKPKLDTSTVSQGYIHFTGSTFAAGSYKVVGRLISNNKTVTGFATAARIVDGLTSSDTIELTLNKASEVPSTIMLVNTVGTPVECTISGITSSMAVGSSATATISTKSQETLDISWYMDGVEVGSGLSYAFSPTIGEHRLDVIAKGPKQASTGSATLQFKGKVVGEAGVPVFMSQIADGTDSVYLSGVCTTAFLPDGKLLVASEGHHSLQICQFVGNTLTPVTTYTTANSNFTLSSITDIAVDEEKNYVFIADNATPKVTKYTYDADHSSLTKVLESTNKAWYNESTSGDFATLGNLAIDETAGKLYVTTKSLETIFATIYNEDATAQTGFWYNCVDADFPVQPKDPSKSTYTANNFDSIVISPDNKFLAALINADGVVYTSPKVSGLLGFGLNACSNQSDDITGLTGLSTMAFLSDTAFVAGTSSGLTLIGGDISSVEDISWINLGSIASGSTAAGSNTIANVTQLGQDASRAHLYALCTGSKNLLTFTTAEDKVTYKAVAAMGTFVPTRYVLSPDGSIMVVSSTTSNAVRVYRIPQ